MRIEVLEVKEGREKSRPLTEHTELHVFTLVMADGVMDRTTVCTNVLLLHWVNVQNAVVLQEDMTLAWDDHIVVSEPIILRISSFLHSAGQSNVVLIFH